MKRQLIFVGIALVLPLLALAATITMDITMGGVAMAQGPSPQGEVGSQAVMGSGFTYQGQLLHDGSPITDTCDMAFRLYDAAASGALVAGPITPTVAVTNGLFTTALDFGSGAFNGEARWLEVRVNCNGAWARLGLEPLTPAPYALALPGLWTQQNATSPNLIGGYSGNSMGAGVHGATIGGGGTSGATNQVTAHYGTLGGGSSNHVGGTHATIGGGGSNQAGGTSATVGGGAGNQAGSNFATVGGGQGNQAVTGTHTTVGGGKNNQASGSYAAVGGGDGNVASGYISAVGGGQGNQASGFGSAIGGGNGNQADGVNATVGGGYDNAASNGYATIAGGGNNYAGGTSAAVGGGYSNQAVVTYTTVGGGYGNEASGASATIAGGKNNEASGDYATIGGGESNQSITGTYNTVAGGQDNEASGYYATIAGGYGNQAAAMWASVGGGQYNRSIYQGTTIGGGTLNQASNIESTVGGGNNNQASGALSTVPGGAFNLAAGDFSFAAGNRAHANQAGCFVWGDYTNTDVTCDVENAFVARTSGGATFYSNSGMTTGVRMAAGDGAWANLSDRALKANVAAVDGSDVLARLAQVPVSTWNYTSQDPSIRHMGPMAQDFYAAFGLGEDDKHIGTVDADGVALAAIQALYAQNQSLATENAALKSQNAAQQQALDDLQKRMAALEAAVNGGER